MRTPTRPVQALRLPEAEGESGPAWAAAPEEPEVARQEEGKELLAVARAAAARGEPAATNEELFHLLQDFQLQQAEGHIPGILIIIFYGISIFCLVALVRASITDPGRLPENPKIPHGEREFWELCNKCNLMRPKRSHHCSRCGHCVRRMDHHCPWINNCVGEDNHWLFLQLCFYTELLTCYALMFSFCHYYYFLPLKKRNLDLFVFRHELAIMRLAAFMGITMLVGITGLFYTQLIGIITDTTSIEKMSNCCEDISRPRKPWQQTFSEVFGTRWKILWFIPFRQRQPLRVPYHFANHV
ncbi:palmitoyltransferase ZDHHC21 isoform X1 [Pongo abelii]|uniref:palmitoyltransferase ZDHHC21 isoform X1 n=1 Tax=Pongo abelii TaxID=9601 RepID=UPI003006F4C6